MVSLLWRRLDKRITSSTGLGPARGVHFKSGSIFDANQHKLYKDNERGYVDIDVDNPWILGYFPDNAHFVAMSAIGQKLPAIGKLEVVTIFSNYYPN